MIIKEHNYRVVDRRGAIYVTYNDLESCDQFIKNMRKIGLKLKAAPNNQKTKIAWFNKNSTGLS